MQCSYQFAIAGDSGGPLVCYEKLLMTHPPGTASDETEDELELLDAADQALAIGKDEEDIFRRIFESPSPPPSRGKQQVAAAGPFFLSTGAGHQQQPVGVGAMQMRTVRTGPHLCGIVSFGAGCGLPAIPGVYTEVSYFLSWLQKEIKKLTVNRGT